MPKQPIWNTRMLELMEHCIAGKIKCTTQGEWCKLLDIETAGIAQIRSGKSSFRHDHVLKAAKLFNINANWVYGLSNEMHRNAEKLSPIQIIQDQLNILKKQGVK